MVDVTGMTQEHARLLAFQTLLDGSNYAVDRHVDVESLRGLCASGIPNHPPHIRPLAYSLLLELLPTEKALWRKTMKDQRRRYYGLVQTFMEELETQPSSSTPSVNLLLKDISRGVRDLKSSFWHRSVVYRKSSPFHPISNEYSGSDGEGSLAREQSSEESDSDSEGDLITPPLMSRRAMFIRLQDISAAERRKADPARPKANTGMPPASNVESAMLSPKITLSVDPTPILPRLHAVRSAPLDASALAPSRAAAHQPTSSGHADTDNSPITLLSPKPLPMSSKDPHSPPPSSLFHPEDHREALSRLLYIFIRSNTQWKYRRSLVDIASILYLAYTGGGKLDLDYAEEQTFWALTAFVGDTDSLMDDGGVDVALEKFERRLHWVNAPLATLLRDRNVEPVLYAHRWLSSFFIREFPLSRTPRLLDFILSEEPASPERQPKVDRMIDIGVAMVSLLKDQLVRRARGVSGGWGMWSDTVEEEEEDPSEALARNLQLLRSYPLEEVGGWSALMTEADELRQLRLISLRKGLDPDVTQYPSRKAVTPVKMPQPHIASSSWGKAVGSLWSSWTSLTPSTPGQSSPVPTTPLRNLKLESYFEHSPTETRGRSDSVASSVSTIQERFASISKHFSPTQNEYANEVAQLPRALLLSGSARLASPSPGRRDSNASSSSRTSPPTDGPLMSPPSVFHSLSGTYPSRRASGGLYQFRARNRSSLGTSPTLSREIQRNLEGEIEKGALENRKDEPEGESIVLNAEGHRVVKAVIQRADPEHAQHVDQEVIDHEADKEETGHGVDQEETGHEVEDILEAYGSPDDRDSPK